MQQGDECSHIGTHASGVPGKKHVEACLRFSQTSSGQMQEQIFQTRFRNVSVGYHHVLLAGQTHRVGQQSFNSIRIDSYAIIFSLDLNDAGQ